MQEITSHDQLDNLLSNRPPETQTYRIDSNILQSSSLREVADGRQMTTSELDELAQYLGVPLDQLKGPFIIDKMLVCPQCSRAQTFLDFIETAIQAGRHSKQMIADILTGKNGHWITISGRNAKRHLICSKCKNTMEYDGHDYSSSTYAYA